MNTTSTSNDNYASYDRVSSNEQAEQGISLEAQFSLAKEYLSKMNINKELIRYSDEGISASRVHFTKRPALMRLINDAKKGLFSTLLVYRRDRLDRSNELHTIKYILLKAGVKIVYLDPNEINVEDNIYGDLIESVISSIAAIEPKLISLRVKSVFREKSLQGLWKTGSPPYGLYHDKELRKLLSIKEEEQIIKKIFNHYVYDKYGYRKITLLLNEANIPFRNNKGVKKKWTISTIKNIISNPIYKGMLKVINDDESVGLIRCSMIETPIISADLFEMAYEIRKKRVKLSVTPRETITTFLLSNILYCSCGSKMIGTDNSYWYVNKLGEKIYKKYTYYFCSLYSQGKHLGECDVKRINANLLHKITLEKCCELFRPTNYEQTREKLIQKQNIEISKTKNAIRELSRRISDIKRKIEVLFENLESSTESHFVTSYEHRISLRNKELQELQMKLLKEKKYYQKLKEKVWTIEEITKKLDNWESIIFQVSPEKQRKMILDVVNRVSIDVDGKLTIQLKLNLESFDSKEMGRSAHNNSYVYSFPFFLYFRNFFLTGHYLLL